MRLSGDEAKVVGRKKEGQRGETRRDETSLKEGREGRTGLSGCRFKREQDDPQTRRERR